MYRAVRLCLVLLAAACASGCLTSTTLIKVRLDGSGTIEQTIAMNADAAREMQKMVVSFAGQNAEQSAPPAELFGEAEMKAAASKMGEGVTFLSSEPITAPDRVGRKALYAFTDIRKLQIDQKPAAPSGSGISVAGPGPTASESVSFAFERLPNGNAVLTAVLPEAMRPQADRAAEDSAAGKPGRQEDTADHDAADQDAEEEPANAGNSAARTRTTTQMSPEQLEAARKMLEGLRIDLALEVDGRIVETNAAYVSGNRLTLLEMDFAQLLGDQEALGRIAKQPKSLEEAKALFKDFKGFKINLERELKVEFGR